MVRGAEGVMLTTTARKVSGSGIDSTQLDAAEAVGMLKHAKGISEKLAGAAEQQKALFSTEAGKAQADFIDLIDPEAKARFPGPVSGQDALKAKHAERTLDAAKPVERFGNAVVLMESAASINWATPASTLLYAGEQLHWTTQSDMHMTADGTISSVAGKGSNLFTHAGGIQVYAGNGPVSLQSHTDALEILADKSITVISVNNTIAINAQQKIVLRTQGASVTLEGANITFSCSGHFSVLGALHPWGGPGGSSAILEPLPDTRVKLFDQGFVVKDEVSGEPLPNQRYRIKLANGSYEEGVTDAEGRTHVVSSVAAEALSLEVAKG